MGIKVQLKFKFSSLFAERNKNDSKSIVHTFGDVPSCHSFRGVFSFY